MAVKYARGSARASVIPLESQEQEAFIAYCHTLPYAAGTIGDIIFAIPNGQMIAGNTQQRAAYMGAMKKRGFRNGVSDLFLPVPRGEFHGLFIEMKRQKHYVVSDEQMDFINAVDAEGYEAVIANGFDEAKAALDRYLGYGPFHV